MEDLSDKNESRVSEFIDNPRKAVWKLSLPVMMGMAVYTFYNLTDMFFVGQLGGDALAALTFNMPVVFLAIGIIFGLGTGATSAIARHLGAGNKQAAEDAARQTLVIGLGFAVVLTVVALTLKREIMRWLGASIEISELAIQYFEIAVPGFLFVVLNVCFRSIMTGEGNTRTPVTFQAVGTLLNVVLDPVLIFSAGLGIAGAAWATVISQITVLVIFCVYIFVRKGSYLNLGSGKFTITRSTSKNILRVGMPSSAAMMMMSLGSMFFNRIVSMFGSDAVAGFGIGGRIDSIYFMPTFALATSQVTLAGMFLGAKRVDLVREILRYTILRAQLIAIVCGVCFYLFAPELCSIFSEDERIQQVSTSYVRTIVFAFPFVTVGIISSRVFLGLGSGIPGMLLTAMRVVLISVPSAYVMTRFMGMELQAVWWAMVSAGVVTSVVSYIWISHRIRSVEIHTSSGATTETGLKH